MFFVLFSYLNIIWIATFAIRNIVFISVASTTLNELLYDTESVSSETTVLDFWNFGDENPSSE